MLFIYVKVATVKQKKRGHVVADNLLVEWSPRKLWRLEEDDLGDQRQFFLHGEFRSRMFKLGMPFT